MAGKRDMIGRDFQSAEYSAGNVPPDEHSAPEIDNTNPALAVWREIAIRLYADFQHTENPESLAMSHA